MPQQSAADYFKAQTANQAEWRQVAAKVLCKQFRRADKATLEAIIVGIRGDKGEVARKAMKAIEEIM